MGDMCFGCFRYLFAVLLILPMGACRISDNCKLPCVDENTKPVEIYEYWGIKDPVVRLTAAGYMLDFRFRVTDIEKSKTLFDKKIIPVVVRDLDNSQLKVPASEKIGALRQSPRFVKKGKQYFMYFANPGRRVKKGEKVTVKIGEFILPGVVVQ